MLKLIYDSMVLSVCVVLHLEWWIMGVQPNHILTVPILQNIEACIQMRKKNVLVLTLLSTSITVHMLEYCWSYVSFERLVLLHFSDIRLSYTVQRTVSQNNQERMPPHEVQHMYTWHVIAYIHTYYMTPPNNAIQSTHSTQVTQVPWLTLLSIG